MTTHSQYQEAFSTSAPQATIDSALMGDISRTDLSTLIDICQEHLSRSDWQMFAGNSCSESVTAYLKHNGQFYGCECCRSLREGLTAQEILAEEDDDLLPDIVEHVKGLEHVAHEHGMEHHIPLLKRLLEIIQDGKLPSIYAAFEASGFAPSKIDVSFLDGLESEAVDRLVDAAQDMLARGTWWYKSEDIVSDSLAAFIARTGGIPPCSCCGLTLHQGVRMPLAEEQMMISKWMEHCKTPIHVAHEYELINQAPVMRRVASLITEFGSEEVLKELYKTRPRFIDKLISADLGL